MVRKIIHIDEEKCNGCGLCAKACHEGAIGIIDGKAKLLRDDYCDGLGDCLPHCPTNAISFVEREAAAYDEQAVKAHMAQKAAPMPCGCPGSMAKSISRGEQPSAGCAESPSRLSQWPVQIKLVNPRAPYLNGADILIAADCTAYAFGSFHERFIKGRICLIGCPKLDEGDYSEKLAEIFSANDVRSVTVTRMEVPCCGGIENAVKAAVQKSGKNIPVNVAVITADGRII